MAEKTVTFYMIFCKDENIKDIYIGSTFDIDKRIVNHKSNCNNELSRRHNPKVYKFIRENGGWENFDYKILNIVEFYDQEMRFKQEQSYIRSYTPSLNSHKAFQTDEEYKEYMKIWIQENKEEIRMREKEYYDKNKEHILEKRRENYYNNAKVTAFQFSLS